MGWYPPTPQQKHYSQLPKVDLHRHLEGSMRVETLMEIGKTYGVTLPIRPDLSSLVQIQTGEPLTFANFLSKFQVLRLFYRSPEVIQRITREAVEDAAADGVVYMDLHFTPAALSRVEGFLLGDVMDWVAQAARQAGLEFGVMVRLIASVNRHESPEMAEKVVRLAAERIDDGIVALDLAGNEAEFSAAPFTGLFREAHQAGLAVIVHAGEWGGAQNVRQALLDLQADRIVHGVRVLEDAYTLSIARECGAAFAVCLTSNVQTGVVPTINAHPFLRMLTEGLNATLNTDDPGISGITLADEYQVACEVLGLSPAMLNNRILAAARVAILKPEECRLLVEKIKTRLTEISMFADAS